MADRRYTINAFTIDLFPSGKGIANAEGITSFTKTAGTGNPALLNLLSREDVRATFFVEAGMTEEAPELLREIASCGHEIALLISSHGSADPVHFLRTVSAGKKALESLLGRSVSGCRILPLSSSGSRSMSEYEILADAGCIYSSSVYPPRDFRLGIQNSKRRAWRVHLPKGSLWELPLTTWRPFGFGSIAVRSAHPEHYPTWAIARNIEGMNRHGEPALLSMGCDLLPSTTELTITGTTAERLQRIFRAYRFSTTFDAFASRLILGFDEVERGTRRRTGITRCDARTAATLL